MKAKLWTLTKNGHEASAVIRTVAGIGFDLHFVLKPAQRMNVNLEYAQGIEDSRGVYLKLGYAW